MKSVSLFVLALSLALPATAEVRPNASNYYGQYNGTYANGLPAEGSYGPAVPHSPYGAVAPAAPSVPHAEAGPNASNYYGQYNGTYSHGLPSDVSNGPVVPHSPYGSLDSQVADAPRPVATASAGRVEHIVAFRFREDATPDEIEQVVTAFRDLKRQIPTILSLKDGENNSTEGQTKGFTHAFIVTFANTGDRDEYVNTNPAHQAFKRLAARYVDDVFVFDFTAK